MIGLVVAIANGGCGNRSAGQREPSPPTLPLAQVAPFARLLGDWEVAGSITFPFTSDEVRVVGCSSIRSRLGGHLIEEQAVARIGERRSEQAWWYTRAPGDSRIRAAHVEAETGLLALWEGELQADQFWIHDLSTPERIRFGNRTLSFRFRAHDVSEGRFHYDIDYSVDLGLTWFVGGKMSYSRSKGCEPPPDVPPAPAAREPAS